MGDRGWKPQGVAEIWGFLGHERGSGIQVCGLAGQSGQGSGRLPSQLETAWGTESQHSPHPSASTEIGRSLTVCFLKNVFIFLKSQTKPIRKPSSGNSAPRQTTFSANQTVSWETDWGARRAHCQPGAALAWGWGRRGGAPRACVFLEEVTQLSAWALGSPFSYSACAPCVVRTQAQRADTAEEPT